MTFLDQHREELLDEPCRQDLRGRDTAMARLHLALLDLAALERVDIGYAYLRAGIHYGRRTVLLRAAREDIAVVAALVALATEASQALPLGDAGYGWADMEDIALLRRIVDILCPNAETMEREPERSYRGVDPAPWLSLLARQIARHPELADPLLALVDELSEVDLDLYGGDDNEAEAEEEP